MTDSNKVALSFARDIKSLFRERDRDSMLNAFDLWSFDDVKANADAILDAVRTGSMPCDGPWPAERVGVFAHWVGGGVQP